MGENNRCATRSAASNKQLPTAAVVSSGVRPDFVVMQAMCGEANASKLMGPANAVDTAVNATATKTMIRRQNATGTPIASAV